MFHFPFKGTIEVPVQNLEFNTAFIKVFLLTDFHQKVPRVLR